MVTHRKMTQELGVNEDEIGQREIGQYP